MKIIDIFLTKIDFAQQKVALFGFPLAVIKRFNEDKAGQQAALITYYGFLSLFPLLMAATTIVGMIVSNNHNLELRIMSNISSYFPVIGEQLTQNIKASSESGLALVIGILIALYGARGGADAFRGAVQHVFKFPEDSKPKFPESILTSLAMIIVGGLGLYSAAILSTFAGSLGRELPYKLLSILIGYFILTATFYFLFTASLGDHVTKRDRVLMSAYSSLGIVVMQGVGGYLVSNQLQKLSPLYGTFALVLGLLFWIYIQAVILMYSIETRLVRKYKLWPRTLTGKIKTAADKSLVIKS